MSSSQSPQDIKTLVAHLESLHDQDRSEGLAWLRSAPIQDCISVWTEIQKAAETREPLAALVGRFAQVGFSELVLTHVREDDQ